MSGLGAVPVGQVCELDGAALGEVALAAGVEDDLGLVVGQGRVLHGLALVLLLVGLLVLLGLGVLLLVFLVARQVDLGLLRALDLRAPSVRYE